ncbi:hypothetical protein Tco_0150805 [Tanacetum coccineum]
MSTHSGPSPTTNTSAVRNMVGRGKEKSQEDPNEPASDAALREFCDKNYNQLLPILAEKMHQEKVQQDRGHQAEEETPGNGSDEKMPAACPEALNQDTANPDHLEEKIRKERRCSEDWKKVYSTGWVIKKRVCPHTPVVHQVSTTRRTKRKLLSCKFPARELSAPGTAQSPKRIQSLRRKRPITGVPSKSKFQKAKCSIIEDDDNPKPMEASRLIRSKRRIRYFDLPKRICMPSHVKTYVLTIFLRLMH